MKAWLLALVVVAFVCTDPVYSLKCCSKLFCVESETCQEGQDTCYNAFNSSSGIPFAKGCAQKCNYLEPYNTICCCTKDNCNI
uniref:3FTx-Cyl-1 n=1 Tax=Cylindrophis ruffus TaxID=186578 RepID=M9SZR1_CYLRU